MKELILAIGSDEVSCPHNQVVLLLMINHTKMKAQMMLLLRISNYT